MPPKLTPREVLERLLDGISTQRWEELHLLFAEDALIHYPFALPKASLLSGRPAIHAYFATMAKYPLRLRARDIVTHETADPETVVMEWNYDVHATTSGGSFEVANVQVTTVRDGLIVRSRDYHNHAVLAHAVGRLSTLMTALNEQGR